MRRDTIQNQRHRGISQVVILTVVFVSLFCVLDETAPAQTIDTGGTDGGNEAQNETHNETTPDIQEQLFNNSVSPDYQITPTNTSGHEYEACNGTFSFYNVDDWEMATFGDMTHNRTTNADGDGSTDYQEFMNGTDPNVDDVDVPADDDDGNVFGCVARAEGAGALAWYGLLAAALVLRRRPSA